MSDVHLFTGCRPRGNGARLFSTVVLFVGLLLSMLYPAVSAYAATLHSEPAAHLAQGFTFPLEQTFMGSTAPGWVLGGTACLTSGNPSCGNDPTDNGWLRLTSNATYQAGFAYYNTPVPTGRGMVIMFDYATWGGTGADGLTFFLFDGATTTFNVGASGGSLGYAQKTGVNGLSGGYLGLGLDEFGNYSNPTEGRVGGPGRIQQSVAVRGPGSGTTGYNYLAGTTNLTQPPWNLPRLDCLRNFSGTTGRNGDIPITGSCGNGSARPGDTIYYRQVRITVTPVGSAYSVMVEMRFGLNDIWRTLFGPFTMPTSAPGTLKMGFAGSTGASTNFHEIRNLIVTQQVPDLTATKSVQNFTTGGGSVAPGEQLLYTVVLKNNTSTTISNVSFTDPIPAYTTYVANSATTTSGTASYSASPATLNVTGITVPGNGQTTVTFRVQVDDTLPAGVTQISNQGSFTYGSTTSQTDGDTVTSGEQPTVIPVTAGPNFDTSTKTVSVFTDTAPVGDVSPGDTLLYRVVLPNTGNQDSPTTTFTDPLPANTTYVVGSATASAGTVSYNSTTKTLTWVAGINAGSQATLEFKVTVNSGVKIRDVISNQGTVTYGSTSVLTDADLSTPGKQPAVLLVGGIATLAATKTADVLSPPLQPGGQVEYTVVLTNTGSYAISGAAFVDTMPANTTYLTNSASTTSGAVSYSDSTHTLNVTGISLNSGATVTIKFTVQVDHPLPTGVTQISNQGVANWDANQSGSNNTSLQTDDDLTIPGQQPTVSTLSNADLAVTKTVDNNNPAEAGTIVYTVRVTNNGPAAVSNVVVSDTLPSGLNLVSSSASQGSYASPTWIVGALAGGASATLTINATVNLGWGGSTITNTASASSELYDAYPTNNTASADLTVKITALTGVITDKDIGAKLANVSVKVTGSQNNICTATTDANGVYTVTSGVSGCLLAPGVATVEATSAPSGYLLTSTGTTITAGVINVQDLALVRPSLSGVVTELGSGVPIVGATVTLTQGANTCTTTTGAGGAYSFVAGTGSPVCTFTAGAATVSAVKMGYQSDTQYPTILSTAPTTQDLALGTADLLITKTDGETVVQPGQSLNYVLTVINNGSITANSVTLTDTLPTYLSYQGWSTNDSGITLVASSNPYRWTLGNLAPDASKSITLTATVAISLPNGTTALANYANVSTTSPEVNIANNERTDVDTVTARPDLTLFKSATSDSVPIQAGNTITYTYVGDNRGSAIATGVIISDTLDAHTTYVAGSAVLVAGGETYPVTATYTDSIKTLVLQLPDIPPGIEGYLRYKATVEDPLPQGVTLITNTAQVTSKETDLDPSNNQSTLVLSAVSGADVYVNKVAVPAANPAVPGSEIVYLLRYGNLGDQAAASVVLTDTIPANTALVTGSITGGGSYNSGNNTITWNLGDLAVGAGGEVSFTTRIDAILPAGVENIANTARITSSAYDPVPDDNQSTVQTAVSAQPDLVIRKTYGGIYFEAGQTVTYTVIYSNTGNQTATGVVIKDFLDEKLTYVGSYPAGTYASNTHAVTWNIGDLPVDGPHTLVLTVTVSALASGELVVNRVEIGDDGANGLDPDPASNSVGEIVRVARPILILEKSVVGQNYVTGRITYTLNYRNNGPVPARSVVISDVLPVNTTLVEGSITGGGNYITGTHTIIWSLGDLAVGAGGQVRFAVTVGAGAGGNIQSEPTLSSESASGTLVLTSTTATLSTPWCRSSDCATLRGYWGGANPVGPPGWEANPQLSGDIFDDSAWAEMVRPGEIEPYWMDAANLGADWVAVTTTTQYTQNYSFFRQYFYLPPNARGFSGKLQISGDDTVDVYINGRFIGTHYGGGGATSMDTSSVYLAGVNLLAVRLTNNTHSGHAIYSGGDHPGLLYRLEAGFARLIPFAAAPAITLDGQPVTFTMQEWLRGKLPFSYTVNFGDGTSSPYTTSTSIAHTYTTTGIYTATVTARDRLGSLATDVLTITVLDDDSKLLTNRAATRYENAVGVSYTGESGAGVVLGLAADLSIVKMVKTGGTVPGAGVTYEIVVTNNGPDAVTGAPFTDTVPATVTDVTWTCTASSGGACAHAGGSGNPLNETVNLSPGAMVTYTLQGTVSPAATGALSNTATVAAPMGVTDPTPGNNSSTVSTDLTPDVNLSINKVSSPKPGLTPGGWVNYSIVVSNSGPSDAANVSIADMFHAALTNVVWMCMASSGSTCTASGSGNIAETATIAAGGNVTYTLRGMVDVGAEVGTVITNTATATYGSTSVEATDHNTLVAWTDLSATKDALDGSGVSSRTVPFVDADGNGGISPGDILKYRVVITNNSASIAYNVTYNDALDANTTLEVGSVACDPSDACTVIQGNTGGDTEVGVNIAGIAGGGSVTIDYRVTVNAMLPFQLATLSNQGYVAGSNAPLRVTDDLATAEADDPTVVMLTRGSISGITWRDDNNNGVIDTGEPALANITVGLYYAGPDGEWDTDDDRVVYDRTDSNGTYSFGKLAEGKYQVGFGQLEGFAFSQYYGKDKDSKVDPSTGLIAELILAANQAMTGVSAGLVSQMDFGNLPARYTSTKLADNGARHVVTNTLFLGATVLIDQDGEEGVKPADNDGIVPPGRGDWKAGQTGRLTVIVNGSGHLWAWFDWNHNGNFYGENGQFDEYESVDLGIISSGKALTTTVTLTVPAGFTDTLPLCVRFRFYPADYAQEFTPYGVIYAGEVEDYEFTFEPTAVTLAAFNAIPQGNAILVTWETASELNSAGFNLYRAETPAGPWVKLNDTLIPPQFPGQVNGGTYEYLDTSAPPHVTSYYRLEDIDLYGKHTFHGPVWAVLGSPCYRIYLPLVQSSP